MAQQEEIVLWLDHRWKKAIERHLKNETLQEHLENVMDELCNQLPAHEYERISNVIQSEAARAACRGRGCPNLCRLPCGRKRTGVVFQDYAR